MDQLFVELSGQYLSIIPVLLVIIALMSILIGTLRTGISPMPSSRKAHRQVVRLLRQSNALTSSKRQLIDCGSGWGNLAFKLARHFPEDKIVGFELSRLPWLFSTLAARVMGLKNLYFIRADFLKQDLSTADVLVCYLHPEGMQKLNHKLTSVPSEYQQQLISIYFALPGRQPQSQEQLTDLYRTKVYQYQLGRPVTSSNGD
ncbi:class I SAM-dependent methyltransferase [Oceanospirillum maris]|uniref:class I SAM-dependent methyltransferase n=1 Tax=Oceanospirillum maris TaxID=64977 RepID=UPI000685F16F|nr:class I SAM-dependent methyltransferase [Oceanospirillum maris]